MHLSTGAFVLLMPALSCCASTYEYWQNPYVLTQPDSPVVVVMNVKHRDFVTTRDVSLGDPIKSIESTAPATTYQTLDVRTCSAGPIQRYDHLLDLIGWGSAPGELWFSRTDDLDAAEPLGGGARLQLGPVPSDRWRPPSVATGMIERHGFLRVWDLSSRAVRDIPFVREKPLRTILPARAGDANLVGLSPDREGLDVVTVPLDPGGGGVPATTHFDGRFKEARLVHGGAWLALIPEAGTSQPVPARKAPALLIVDVRSGDVVRRVDRQSDRGTALIEADRLWFAHLGNEACGRLQVVDLGADTHHDLALLGCAFTVQPWEAGAPFVSVTTKDVGAELVDLRTGRMIPRPPWPKTASAVIGNDYFWADGPDDVAAVDLVTGKRRAVVTSIGGIQSITAVPSARRIVIVNDKRSVLVYDLETHRVSKCM